MKEGYCIIFSLPFFKKQNHWFHLLTMPNRKGSDSANTEKKILPLMCFT
jgi:hypothetical protein